MPTGVAGLAGTQQQQQQQQQQQRQPISGVTRPTQSGSARQVQSAVQVALPIYAEAVGPLKAIGYVEEGRLNAQQVAQVKAMGNETDGKYIWNRQALDRLLLDNEHLFGPEGSAPSMLTDDFVARVKDRNTPIEDPTLLCLVHVAFLDAEQYAAGRCGDTPIIVPEEVAQFVHDVLEYGPNLTPEESWVVMLAAPPQGWPRLLRTFNDLKVEADRWRQLALPALRAQQSRMPSPTGRPF